MDELVFAQNNYCFCFYVFGFAWQACLCYPDGYQERRTGPAFAEASAVEWVRLRYPDSYRERRTEGG